MYLWGERERRKYESSSDLHIVHRLICLIFLWIITEQHWVILHHLLHKPNCCLGALRTKIMFELLRLPCCYHNTDQDKLCKHYVMDNNLPRVTKSLMHVAGEPLMRSHKNFRSHLSWQIFSGRSSSLLSQPVLYTYSVQVCHPLQLQMDPGN